LLQAPRTGIPAYPFLCCTTKYGCGNSEGVKRSGASRGHHGEGPDVTEPHPTVEGKSVEIKIKKKRTT
jgi:hypothetical protein